MGINRNYDVLFTNQSTEIATLDSLVGGSLYVDGSYTDVPLTGGTGSGATANITVASGAVTVVTLVNTGSGYTVADTLSADNADLGGAGSGFTIDVATLTTTFVSDPFQLSHVKSDFAKAQLRTSGTLNGGSVVLQSKTPTKNLLESDQSIGSSDWKDTDDIVEEQGLDPFRYSTLDYRLKISGIGPSASFSAEVIYNAE